MIWKPKEKELSREEAIAEANKELTPYWFGTKPQIVGVPVPDGYVVLPLDESFSKKSWLIFFIDPTEYTGQSASIFAKEWYRRYHLHDLEFLFFLLPMYQNWRTRTTVNEYKENLQLKFPIAVDIDLSVSGAFNAKTPPMVLLLREGHQYFGYSGKNWLQNAEVNIQDFLRSRDPGLSLFPPYQPSKSMVHDIKRMEFGYAPILGKEAPFEKPGFIPSPDGYRKGRFHGLRPKRLGEDEIFISGEWLQDAERIVTSDPNATLSFVNPGATVSLIAQSLSKTIEAPTVVIDIEGNPAFESIAAESLILDESGQSVIRVKQFQVYHLLKDLPSKNQQINFHFPNANMAPVALYGLRFGEKVGILT